MTRTRDTSSSTSVILSAAVGAAAGFAVGVFLAQRMGGAGGLASRVRRGRRADATSVPTPPDLSHDLDEDLEDEIVGDYSSDEELGARVLEVFSNDPVLSERAIDIEPLGDGVVELTGWVDDDREIAHATTLARGVPGVFGVVNHLAAEAATRGA
ncbi:MAG TPA: BON domain-containing protein [Gemmatimonadaceae bacterium]|jgi:hypothetical protein|nr:BON domain-containing protein [Gemmatimonadaceae bacterium]